MFDPSIDKVNFENMREIFQSTENKYSGIEVKITYNEQSLVFNHLIV